MIKVWSGSEKEEESQSQGRDDNQEIVIKLKVTLWNDSAWKKRDKEYRNAGRVGKQQGVVPNDIMKELDPKQIRPAVARMRALAQIPRPAVCRWCF